MSIFLRIEIVEHVIILQLCKQSFWPSIYNISDPLLTYMTCVGEKCSKSLQLLLPLHSPVQPNSVQFVAVQCSEGKKKLFCDWAEGRDFLGECNSTGFFVQMGQKPTISFAFDLVRDFKQHRFLPIFLGYDVCLGQKNVKNKLLVIKSFENKIITCQKWVEIICA